MPINVDIQLASHAKGIPSVKQLKAWAICAIKYTHNQGEVTIRIVNTAEMCQLNGRFRNKSGVTNVLSFPFVSPPGVKSDLLGDVIICHAKVQQEARAQQKILDSHYAHMVVHGVLHLLGYDHIESADANKMELLERDLLTMLGFQNPYGGDH